MASTYITQTISDGGNTKSTFSAWVKRSGLGSTQYLFHTSENTNNDVKIIFNSSNNLRVLGVVSGSTVLNLTTNRLFRDNSAFYHIVISFDLTQSTEADRVKMYINGVQETSFSTATYPAQNYSSLRLNNNGDRRTIGTIYDGGGSAGSGYFDGLLAHVHWTDNYAYAATDFGETDSTSGIWVPKTSPSVTYGTNGFFLKFENSGNMDLDSSGNNLSFTTSGNLTQNIDSPTNNFATLNRLYYTTESGTLDFSNRNFTKSSSVTRSCFSTLAPSAGKWYCEVKVANDTDCKLGIVNLSYEYNLNGQTVDFAASGGAYSYNENGQKQEAGASAASYGTGYNAADIIGIAMDLDNSKLYFSLNGTFQNSGVPTSGSTGTGAISITAGGDYAFAGKVNGGCDLGFNFGSGDYAVSSTVASGNADDNGIGSFEYDVPAGYYALCTKNIKEFG